MSEPVRTFKQAFDRGAYELARRWIEPGPVDHEIAAGLSVGRELEQIAVMAGLARWLTNWLPIHVHSAVQAGATVADVAAAIDLTRAEVAARWAEWAVGQRALYEQYHDDEFLAGVGMTPDEYHDVATALGVIR